MLTLLTINASWFDVLLYLVISKYYIGVKIRLDLPLLQQKCFLHFMSVLKHSQQ